MKKLLITSMAAVAIGLYAKAEFTANESFEKNAQDENLAEGPFFDVDNETGKYIYGEDWTSEATPEDGIFTVTNISKITSVGDSYPTDRPLDGDNANALAIDTEKALIRRVIPGTSSTDLEGASLEGDPIFFDSVVQFTATETAPETTGAKLVAWLYKTEELAEGEKGLFGETDPISKLVITAVYDDTKDLFKTNYLTDVTIQPETWHRLTIKSFVKDSVLQFEVRVDGDIVEVNGAQVPFISLDELETQDRTLKGVAFEGKGVVDDLVFTTTDPFPGGGEDPAEKVNVSVTINDVAAIELAFFDETQVTSGSASYEVEKGSSHSLQFMLFEGYELVSSSPVASNVEGLLYTITVEPNSDVTIEIVVQKVGGGSGVTVDGTTVEFDANGEITNITTAFDGKTVSGNLDTSKFKAYYVVSVDNGVLRIKLDQKVAAPFAEATEGQEVLDLDATMDDGETPAVGIRINTFTGLYYGLGTAAELGGSWDEPTDWEDGTGGVIQLKAAKQGDTRFYKIVVTDINPNPAK